MAKYRPVRRPIVSGLPTAGGFAGYFRNGTRMIVVNPPSASTPGRGAGTGSSQSPLSHREPDPNRPPMAAPKPSRAVSNPAVDWTLRLTSSTSPAPWACGLFHGDGGGNRGFTDDVGDDEGDQASGRPTSRPRTSSARTMA